MFEYRVQRRRDPVVLQPVDDAPDRLTDSLIVFHIPAVAVDALADFRFGRLFETRGALFLLAELKDALFAAAGRFRRPPDDLRHAQVLVVLAEVLEDV